MTISTLAFASKLHIIFKSISIPFMQKGLQQSLIFMTLGLCFLGCKLHPPENLDSYGATLVQLVIDSEDMALINSGVFSKSDVSAKVKINNEEFIARVNYAGATSLDDFKKNYQVKLINGKYKGRNEYRLASSSQDSTGLKSIISFPIFCMGGLFCSETDGVALYVNRQFKGFYTLIETVDENFYKTRNVKISSLYKTINRNGTLAIDSISNIENHFNAKHENDSYAELPFFIKSIYNSRDNIEEVKKLILYKDFQNYLAICVLTLHKDSDTNNFFLYTTSKDKKVGITPWDLDRTLIPPSNFESLNSALDYFKSNALFKIMLENEETRQEIKNRIQELIIGDLNYEKVLKPHILKIINRVEKVHQQDVLLKMGNPAKDIGNSILKNLDEWHRHLQKELKENQ